jgi:hypothetical protein
MQPHAPHAGIVQAIDVGLRSPGFEQRDAAIIAFAGIEQIDKHPVIAAMASRLNEYTALKAEEFVQAE